MSKVLRDLSPAALTSAIERNLLAFLPFFGCLPGAEVHDDIDLLWIVSDLRHCLFNSVARARLSPGDVDAAIDRQVALHRARKVPLMWWIGPSTRPTDLATHLELHGFTHDSDEVGMAAEIEQLNDAPAMPPEGHVVRVKDLETLGQWNRARTVGWNSSELGERAWMRFATSCGLGADSPFRYFAAFWNGEPVAAAMTFLAAGVAGIYNVATIPEMRGRGFGSAVTLAAARDAGREGYAVAALIASDMGKPIYHRLGFREYCTIGEYTWSETAPVW